MPELANLYTGEFEKEFIHSPGNSFSRNTCQVVGGTSLTCSYFGAGKT